MSTSTDDAAQRGLGGTPTLDTEASFTYRKRSDEGNAMNQHEDTAHAPDPNDHAIITYTAHLKHPLDVATYDAVYDAVIAADAVIRERVDRNHGFLGVNVAPGIGEGGLTMDTAPQLVLGDDGLLCLRVCDDTASPVREIVQFRTRDLVAVLTDTELFVLWADQFFAPPQMEGRDDDAE